MPISHQIQRATYSGAKAQNAEWAATDYTGLAASDRVELCILQVSVSVTAAVIEVTLDSGTTWAELNGGTAIGTGQMFQFDIYVTGGDEVNFRATNASGTTVDYGLLVVDLSG